MPFHALGQVWILGRDLVQTRVQDLDRAGVLAGGKQNDRQRDPSLRPGSAPPPTTPIAGPRSARAPGSPACTLALPSASHSGAGSCSGSSSAIALLRYVTADSGAPAASAQGAASCSSATAPG